MIIKLQLSTASLSIFIINLPCLSSNHPQPVTAVQRLEYSLTAAEDRYGKGQNKTNKLAYRWFLNMPFISDSA